MLAFLSQEEIDAIIEQNPLIRRTQSTITRKAHLLEHLASVRERTVALDMEEGPPGAYVYFIYGTDDMFNVIVGVPGEAEAVLFRAAEALDGWQADLCGRVKLALAFRITRADNASDLTRDKIFFESDPHYRPRVLKTKRIGVTYAKHWQHRLLRFIDAKSPVASKLRR